MIIDSFCEPPTIKECKAAVWSEGAQCKVCVEDCYRKGWSKAMATADNRKLVALMEKHTVKKVKS